MLTPADIKTALKEAREALKSKKYPAAIEHCKSILDHDADNFMALVLMGASLQESDPTKAATFLRKAVKLPNNNPAVALQGLSLCAEPNEMPDICRQLLKHTPDRYEDLFGKLLKAAERLRQMAADVEPFVSVLHDEIRSEDAMTEERRNAARYHLAKLYVINSGCTSNVEWQAIFLDALEFACLNPCPASAESFQGSAVSVHATLFRAYLKLLYTLGAQQHGTLLRNACLMSEQYPTTVYPLECICNVFVERFASADGFRTEDHLQQPIAVYAQALLGLFPRSTAGLMVNSIVAFGEGQFVQARSLLTMLYNIQSDWDVCIKWLALTHQQLNAPHIAEALLRKLQSRDIVLAECLVDQSEDAAKVSEAIQLCHELLPAAKTDEQARIYFTLAKGLIATAQTDLIDATADTLIELGCPDKASRIRALHQLQQGNADKAVDLLTPPPSPASCEHLLLLGRARFHLHQYPGALASFLAATKIEPSNSACFYWLAEVYQINSNSEADKTRAIRCLEKCLQLNSRHRAATTSLVGLYADQKAHDAIEKVLAVTIADPFAGLVVPTPWVWLLLGAHRQLAGRYNDAVTAFRAALREEPGNVRCWMGLADTYRERGSLSSALKVYQKCLEMRGQAAEKECNAEETAQNEAEYLYAQLQVATLKTALGSFAEAVLEFGVLLAVQADFVPALKGLAEAQMGLATGCVEGKLFGRGRQHAAEAVDALTRALRKRHNVAALWRQLASALSFVARLAQTHAHLAVSVELTCRPDAAADTAETTVELHSAELLALASSCLSRALKIRPDDSLLWYDLALNHYHRALKYSTAANCDAPQRRQHFERAFSAARYTLQLNQTRWQNWNLLGIISASADIDNAALAQHAFIKAVQLNRTAAVAWTNLGVLYAARANDVRLANRAFGQAQQAQTDYVPGWTGQACLAERLGQPSEAIDLFQHATRLQHTGEGALGFVHWICMALQDMAEQRAGRTAVTVEPHVRYVCERMFGPTEALDAIEWYLRAEDEVSVSTCCFAGYLYYGQSLWTQAVRCFERAVKLAADDAVRDKMLFNLGSSLLRAARPADAQNAFHAVTSATFETAIGLAVAHQLDGQFEEAYGVYESALQILAQTDMQRSQTLVAMSAIVYAFQGERDAKSLLFHCIGLPEPPVEGLFSGCALGIVHKDVQLSELILKELQKHVHDPRYLHHIAFLTAQFHQRNNRSKRAHMYLLSQVHMHPAHLELRKVLANFIMQTGQRSESHMRAASRVAESTIVLQLSNAKSIDSSVQGAKSLAMASEAMRCVDQNRRKKLAQRAVHVNPTCRQAWAALLMCD